MSGPETEEEREPMVIALEADENGLRVDLGGRLDAACCGKFAAEFNRIMAEEFGVEMKEVSVHCGLAVSRRCRAKVTGLCNCSPLNSDPTLPDLIERGGQR